MKISIITTVDHNVGDDFVREGIKYLLRKYYANKDIEFQNIHKHSPITTRYGFEKIRYNKFRIANVLDSVIPAFVSKDRVKEADLLVQSGAPVYWCHDGGSHCFNNEWYGPLIKRRFTKAKNIPLINLAAGTCQPYHSDGSEFCSKCEKYMKEFYDYSKITTARDTLSKVAFEKIGKNIPVIPCSSIFAVDEHGLKNEGEDFVVVNYMRGGAHYTIGQDIDFDKWEKAFKDFYFELKKSERVIFSCHNQKEVNEALEIDSNAEIFYEKDDYLAYMKLYSKAKCGIMNRVHGGFMLASFGKPSIVIGNDSRARMAGEIGIQHYFVNDATTELLCSEYERICKNKEEYKTQFESIKEKAYQDYMEAFKALEN